ncbi:MAG: cytidine deaminase [Bacteroidetes bacterium]|nr:cytidine deaminase [Bacteroidota bacterium]
MNGVIKHEFVVEEWEADELSSEEQKLLEAAFLACSEAYAPYSNFKVGSAVLLESGQIVRGSNQENSAYPSGLCGERVAFFAAAAQHPNERIIAAAVVTDCEMDVLHFSPCGGCRQVLLESENRQQEPIRFLMQSKNSSVIVSPNVHQFLPLNFRLPT